MNDCVIEQTNLCIEGMPKKEKSTGSFLRVRKQQCTWLDCFEL